MYSSIHLTIIVIVIVGHIMSKKILQHCAHVFLVVWLQKCVGACLLLYVMGDCISKYTHLSPIWVVMCVEIDIYH